MASIKKLVGILGVFSVALLAVGRSAPLLSATETCTATCSGGAVLMCTSASGTCSSSSMSVTCCGGTHTCTAVNAWQTCINSCTTALNRCIQACDGKLTCVGPCYTADTACKNRCGAEPATTFSC